MIHFLAGRKEWNTREQMVLGCILNKTQILFNGESRPAPPGREADISIAASMAGPVYRRR
ncbi:hypothetical protein OBV_21950 [Oscillibacter valericigenes Sjm18-20]|nr:hypothetical protein OBV_21950 [Oscillibacter valericigenes Sjm18-20]